MRKLLPSAGRGRSWSASRRFHGWLATWLQDRRRSRAQDVAAPGAGPGGLGGCRLWLDAATLLLNDGDPVAFWEDQSGHGNNVVSEFGLGPEFDTDVFGACVAFNGNMYLVCETALMPQPFTVLVVGEFAAAMDEFESPRLSIFCGGFMTAFYTSELHDGDLSLYTTGADSRTVPGTLTYDTPCTVAVTAVGNGVAGSLFANGVKATLNGAFMANNGNGFDDAFYVGTWSAGQWPIVGRIAELVVYDRALSDGEVATLHTLLAAKWGIE